MCNKSDPLHKKKKSILQAWKRGYKIIFHHQKFVFCHKIKPKKAKSFSDIVLKNNANRISNKLDTFLRNYTSLFITSISATIYGIHVTSYHLALYGKMFFSRFRWSFIVRDNPILRMRAICKAWPWFELALRNIPLAI